MDTCKIIRYEDELVKLLLDKNHIKSVDIEEYELISILSNLGYERLNIDSLDEIAYLGPRKMPKK